MDRPESERPAWEQVEPTTEPEMEPTLPLWPAGLPKGLPLWRVVLGLAIWPLLEQLMFALVWFVDSALAGHLPEGQLRPASDAIGAAVYFLWLMGLLQGSVGVGSTALIAREVGANRHASAESAMGQSITVAAAWGLINGVLFYVFADLPGRVMFLEPQARELCTMYMRMVALVAPLRSILIIGSACLRGAGDTRTPFFIMLVVNLVNVAISVTLVAAYGQGLFGIALGTAVAWGLGGLLLLVFVSKGRGGIRLHARHLPWHWPMAKRLLRISLPALIEGIGHWTPTFGTMVIVGYLAKLGMETNPVGTHNIAIRVEGLSFIPGFAFAIAASTVAGQFLGANDPQRARQAVWWAWVYGAAIMVTLGVLFITIPRWLAMIVTNDPLFLEQAPPLLFVAGWAQIGFVTAMVLSGGLRGAGDTRTTMAITYFSTFCVRLPLAYLFGITLGFGLLGVWIGLSIELMVRGALFLWRFLQDGWTKVKV